MKGELPSRWRLTPLSELLVVLESGARPRGGVRNIKEGVPSIGGEHLNYKGGFDFTSIKYVPKKFASSMKKGHIQKNDILVVKDGATTGKTSFVDDDFPYKDAVVNEHVFICRPKSSVNPVYLFRFMISREGQNRILENFKGSAQGGINQSFVTNTQIPVAPISEQHRIVEKLQRLLHKIDNNQGRLEKIPLIIKHFRQSILAVAFSGGLTKEWRERNDIFADWEEIKLRKKCKKFQYGTSKKSQKSGDTPVLRMGNLQSGEIDWSNLVYTSDKNEIEKFKLRKNTVLFNRTNSPELVGKTAIFRGDRAAIFAGYLIRIETNDDLDPEYLNYYLNSCYANKWKYHVKTDGVSQSNINAKKLGDLDIPFPSIQEQREIVGRLKILLGLADKIDCRYLKVKKHINNLTQSILAQAFRGELVSQKA